jgi:curved DNA-binding protein CbpA
MASDYYAVLRLPRSASPEQIKSRFREMARSMHPDRVPAAEKGAAERTFQRVTEAFNILSDPDRRRRHDAELSGTRR